MGRSRSRSRSPYRRERRRSTSRDRDRRRRDRRRSRSRSPGYRRDRDRFSRRSRSRSPGYRRRRSRTPSPRRYRRSSSRSRSPKGKPTFVSGAERRRPGPSHHQQTQKEEIDESQMTEEELEMMKVMGFFHFDSTKGKFIEENQSGPAAGAANVNVKRKYRQYMNRRGGFNRPLDFVA